MWQQYYIDNDVSSESDDSDSDEYESYFHHTDKKSAKKILRSGKILQSMHEKGDSTYGNGTYLTKKGPDHTEKEIAINNYGKNLYRDKINEGKTDVAIELEILTDTVKDCSDARDVYKYKGDLEFMSADVKSVSVHIRDNNGGYVTMTHSDHQNIKTLSKFLNN